MLFVLFMCSIQTQVSFYSLTDFPLLFMLPLSGELANLRGDMGQMDFGALDYSNDRRKVRRRGVVRAAGHPFIHSHHNTFKEVGKCSQTRAVFIFKKKYKQKKLVAPTTEDSRDLKPATFKLVFL